MFRAILITDSKPNEFSIRIQLPFLFSLVTVYIKKFCHLIEEFFAILSSQIDVRCDDYQHDGRKL